MADVSRWPPVSWTSWPPRGAHHPSLALAPLFTLGSLQAWLAKWPFRARRAATSLDPLGSKRPSKARSSLGSLPADLPWSAGEPLLAGFPRGPDPTRRPPLPPGPCAARAALRPSFARWTLGTRHLARLPLGRLGSFRQLVAGLPLHRVGIAGHHHPLQVDRLRLLALNLFADENLPIEVDPAVHQLERLLAHRLAVDVEKHLVTEHPEVDLVPLRVKHLRNIPRQGL